MIKREIAEDNATWYGTRLNPNPYEGDGPELEEPNVCSQCAEEIMEWQHAYATASTPETYYLQCPACGHQSGHC